MTWFKKLFLPLFIVGNALDAASTLFVTKTGRGTEANPVMGAGDEKAIALKTTVDVVAGVALAKAHKDHPVAANATAGTIGVVMGAIGLHNLAVGKKKPTPPS